MIVFYSMCYLFYKIGKSKQSNPSNRWPQMENLYGRQLGDSSTYPAAVNPSYGNLTPATTSFDEDPTNHE